MIREKFRELIGKYEVGFLISGEESARNSLWLDISLRGPLHAIKDKLLMNKRSAKYRGAICDLGYFNSPIFESTQGARE